MTETNMASRPPVTRLELLKYRNDKLAAHVVVQRQEITQLEHKVDELQEKEEAFQETILCVNRLWEELNGSIDFLQYRANGALENGDTENAEAADAALLQETNPFLAKLLGTFLAGNSAAKSSAESLADDPSEVEAALRKRMAATMQAAARVLDSIEQLRCRGAAAGPTAGGGTGSATPGAKESQLAAMNNLLRAENNRLRDQALQDSARIKQLQSSLADNEDELLVAKRKVVQLKEGAAAIGAAPAPAPVKMEAESSGVPPPLPPPEQEDAKLSEGPDLALYKRLLEQRTAEVDAREALLLKAQREARDLKDRLGAEREAAQRARQYDLHRAQHLATELEDLGTRLQGALRDRDQLVGRLHELQLAADQGQHATRRLASAGTHIAELDSQLTAARTAWAAAEEALRRERHRGGNPDTTQELRQLGDALQREVAALKAAAARHKAAAVGAAAAKASAQAATCALEENRAQLVVVRERLAAAQAAAAAHSAAEKEWAERETELKLFAEVSQSFLGEGGADVASLRASEAALRQQVQQLKEQVASNVGACVQAEAAERETGLLAQVEALQEENAALTARVEGLQREAADLRAEAAALREDGDSFMKEVENVTDAYENAREQNQRLLAAIAARDEDNVRLLEEAATAGRERSAAVEARDAAGAAARRAEEAAAAARDRVGQLEKQVKTVNEELAAARADARNLAARCDGAKWDQAQAEATAAAADRDLEAARREAADRAVERDAHADNAQHEATRADRAEQVVAELQSRIRAQQEAPHAAASSGIGGGRVDAELAALRKMVQCNVCHARYKDRIITKCSHLFCAHCISANLATRHRKCPGCSAKFGEGDVKPFYFT